MSALTSLPHRPEIDGLRGIAVAAVILYHAKPSLLPGGFLGVDIFFVISGYLITRILMLSDGSRSAVAGFYERRVRRLAPALGAVLVPSTIAAWLWLPPEPLADYGHSLASAAAFASNIFFWRHSSYFDLAAAERPLLHTWSLGVEEQFYILYPLVLLWCLRRSPRLAAAAIGAGALISFAAAWLLWRGHPEPVFFLLPTRAWELLAGAAICTIPHHSLARLPASVRGLACGCALLALLAVLALAGPGNVSPAIQAAAVLSTAILIASGTSGPVQRALGWRPLVGLGVISYSAYLWHQPLFVFAHLYALSALGPLALVGLICATLVCAFASWRWIERPARNPANGSRRKVFGAAMAGTLLFVAAGFLLASPKIEAWRSGAESAAVEMATTRMKMERQAAIRAGTCHFNGVFGPARTAQAFLSQWNCWGSDAMVVGDSHAADTAAALRTIGLDAGQFTWAGCSLVPRLMTPDCRHGFDRFRVAALARGPGTIVLANKFDPAELTGAAFSEMIAYWSLPGARIWLFTGRPEYPDARQMRWRAARFGMPASALSVEPDVEDAETSERLALAVASGNDAVQIIESRRVFCAITKGACAWQLGEEPLIYDTSHLTTVGARLFGTELVRLYPFVRSAHRGD